MNVELREALEVGASRGTLGSEVSPAAISLFRTRVRAFLDALDEDRRSMPVHDLIEELS